MKKWKKQAENGKKWKRKIQSKPFLWSDKYSYDVEKTQLGKHKINPCVGRFLFSLLYLVGGGGFLLLHDGGQEAQWFRPTTRVQLKEWQFEYRFPWS